LTAKLGGAFVQMEQMAVKAGLSQTDIKKSLAYKVVSQSGDSATIQFLEAGPPRMDLQTRQVVQPKLPPPVEMVRVSGKWLPKNVVDNWKEGVEATKGQIDFAMPGVSATLATVVIPFASSLANAKTQQEFNAALQQITSTIPGMGGSGGNGMAGMQGGSNFGGEGAMPGPGGPGPGGAPGGGLGKGGRAVITDQ
jgi:hypothetical protein